MEKILITGGAGNLGRAVAARAARRGYGVRIFDLPGLDYAFAQGLPACEVLTGDIRDAERVRAACDGVRHVAHLAAVMPPASEGDRDLARSINVEGTRTLLRSMQSGTLLVFASSVATYGFPGMEVVEVTHPQTPIDYYGETKLQNERDIVASGIDHVFLRISGISVPALQEIPRPWFFQQDQKLEFVHLEDAAEAVVNCIGNPSVRGRILHVAGGNGWRMTGGEYSRAMCEVFDLPPERAHFREEPGWTGWYETADSQTLLAYQNHSYEQFLEELRRLYLDATA